MDFPKQTKGHIVEETIFSDIAKGQFSTTDPVFPDHYNDIVSDQAVSIMKIMVTCRQGRDCTCTTQRAWRIP